MSLDQKLFTTFYRFAKKHFGSKPREIPTYAAKLQDLLTRLTIFGRALSGKMLEIFESNGTPALVGNRLFLPATMELTGEKTLNEACYFGAIAFAVKASELGVVARSEAKDEEIQILQAQVAESVFKELNAEYPALASTLLDVESRLRHEHSRATLRALLSIIPQENNEKNLQEQASNTKLQENALAKGTELKAKAQKQIEVVKLEQTNPNPVSHILEKVQTAEEYRHGAKIPEGSDELLDHEEALSELNIKHVIRTQERTDSVYKADIALDVSVADIETSEASEAACHIYDEWDFSKGTYKKDWCKVFVPSLVRSQDPELLKYVTDTYSRQAKHIDHLKKRLEFVLTKRRMRSRQTDGPEFDFDALIEASADLKALKSPSEKLYLSQRRQERDVATLILIDSSLSTDGWVLNRRVLDVIKDSVFTLAKVLTHFSDTLEVGAFYSHTRNECHYIPLKHFETPWKQAECSLAGLQPKGYTRIGAVLRHCTSVLAKQSARKKMLLLLSDGKPTDYDKYEGRYGIHDVRQAVKEASQIGVQSRAIAIESVAKNYLPQMFGHGRFRVLSNPDELSDCLVELYSELLK